MKVERVVRIIRDTDDALLDKFEYEDAIVQIGTDRCISMQHDDMFLLGQIFSVVLGYTGATYHLALGVLVFVRNSDVLPGEIYRTERWTVTFYGAPQKEQIAPQEGRPTDAATTAN